MLPPADVPPRQRFADALQHAWASRGPGSTALLPAAWCFEAVSFLRRQLYARGLLPTNRLPAPVVVVGNLVAGGAGKTPTVMAIATMLSRQGFRPGIVSRGYGRDDAAVAAVDSDSDARRVGDEPLLMRRRTGLPVFVASDRAAAGHALLQAHPDVDIVISDDGLQHLALERDVEVLVFDERGGSNGRLLPAGPLRERVPATLATHRLVIYNAAAPTTALPGYLARRSLSGVVPLDAWWRGEPASLPLLESLRGRALVAVAGLARPQRFFAMLRDLDLTVVEVALGDHHDFQTLPWPPATTDVVLTEKDAVKLPPSRRIGTRVWVAALDFQIEVAFEVALLALVRAPSVLPPDH